ncbi:hypothetical protein [Shinella sp. HZN7]|uniref:hypothetical protein n=1 Tax=Shinella sp. (strain HZN7) TaxID=879274 RepID=UPI0007DAAB16|nr:hypothetical protein [Shinella sp. HZN7]ANH08455.1 hypothetical protein shn_30380 [Shinella sp. HZN7]
MVPFRVRKDAKSWFKDLYRDKSFKIDFDTFYFCFIAGVATGRKRAMAGEDTSEMIDYFPQPYGASSKILVGLFLSAEMEKLGLVMTERERVHLEIAKLVRHDSSNHLTAAGVGEFSQYAHGGFDVLLEWFDDRPRSLDTFERQFKRKLDAQLSNVG